VRQGRSRVHTNRNAMGAVLLTRPLFGVPGSVPDAATCALLRLLRFLRAFGTFGGASVFLLFGVFASFICFIRPFVR
jgi:hypothetical protein